MTKAFDTWQERLDTGRLTKAQIGQAAQVICRRAQGFQRHGRASALTDSECEILAARLFRQPVLLTKEQTAQGLDWLDRHGRKELELRRDEVERLVSSFSHFSWRGEIETFGRYDNTSVPIWHIHLNDGTEYAYFYASGWRSGGTNHGVLWQVTPGFSGVR